MIAGRRPVVVASACAAGMLALACAGCGEQRGIGATQRTTPTPLSTPKAALGTAVASVDVSLTEYRLSPANPRVAHAGVIEFAATNDGESRHELRVDGPTGEVSTPVLGPGDHATIRVRLPPGTYKWYCPIADHEQRGMVGRVRVAE